MKGALSVPIILMLVFCLPLGLVVPNIWFVLGAAGAAFLVMQIPVMQQVTTSKWRHGYATFYLVRQELLLVGILLATLLVSLLTR